MWLLIREGGWPMWFLLLFGVLLLAASVRFAIKPARAQIGTILGMGAATLFTALMGIAADLGAVGHNINRKWEDFIDYPPARAVLQGFAESMSPGVMGFSFLALAGLLYAVGAPRLDQNK